MAMKFSINLSGPGLFLGRHCGAAASELKGEWLNQGEWKAEHTCSCDKISFMYTSVLALCCVLLCVCVGGGGGGRIISWVLLGGRRVGGGVV